MKRLAITFLLFTLTMAIYAQSWELRMAKQYIENGDYKSAALKLRPLAEGGNAEAQYLAAGLFMEGNGVIKSEVQAVKYYQLSAQQLYKPAIFDLSEYYVRRNEYSKMYMLIKGACDRNEDFLLDETGFILGKMHYEGKGTEKDMEQGWKQMLRAFKNMKKTNNFYFDEEKLVRYFNEEHKAFTKYFIDKYAKTGSEEKFLEVLVGKQNENYFLPEWNSTIIEMVVEKIPTLEYSLQRNILTKLNAMRPITIASCFLGACMYYNGYGTPANLKNAKIYAKTLVGNCNDYPFIMQKVDEILSDYAVGEVFPGLGEVISVNGDNVTVNGDADLGYAIRTMTKAELRQKVRIKEAKKQAHEQRKRNMTAISHCPQINAGQPYTSYENGTLKVTIPISLKAMNKCELTASNAKYKYPNEKNKYASCRTVGLKTIGNRCFLMPREMAWVTIYIKNAPRIGELDYAYVTLQCNYGTGTVRINDVVW